MVLHLSWVSLMVSFCYGWLPKHREAQNRGRGFLVVELSWTGLSVA